jgi:glutamate carboxypeptidase
MPGGMINCLAAALCRRTTLPALDSTLSLCSLFPMLSLRPLAVLALTSLFIPGATSATLAPIEEKITAAVDQQIGGFARDLEAAVKIDSATENHVGVRQLSDQFGAQLKALGFAYRYAEQPASTGRAGHLVAERTGTKGQRVLLIGHLDTVLPGGKFELKGDRALGSGTSDIKGGDLILIYALRALHAAGALDDTRITVVMTGDEEAVGKPVEVARKELFDAAKRSDVALSFEGAIGKTATVARRSSTSWEIEVQGATGHSSGIFSAAMGAGSIYEASRILQGFYDELRKFEGLTLNPALISGGTETTLTSTGGTTSGKTNITAQSTRIRGDLRAVSAEQLAAAEEKMKAIVAKNLPRTSATITFSEGYPAMPDTPANRAVMARLDEVSRDLGFGAITAYDPRGRGAGDVAFVSPPVPAIDGLGIRGGGSHAPNEWADVAPASLSELVKRTAVLIYRLTH